MIFFGFAVPGGLFDVVNVSLYPLANSTCLFSSRVGELCIEYAGDTTDTLTPGIPIPWSASAGADGERVFGCRGTRLSLGATGDLAGFARFLTGAAATDELVQFQTTGEFGADGPNATYNSYQVGRFGWSNTFHTGSEDITKGVLSTLSSQAITRSASNAWEIRSFTDGVFLQESTGSSGPMPHTEISSIVLGNWITGDTADSAISAIWVMEGLLTDAEHFVFCHDIWQVLEPQVPMTYFVPSGAAGVVSGTLTETLDAFTVAADALSIWTGSTNATLEDTTLVGTGNLVVVSGSLAETLAGITATASGSTYATGSLSETLDAVTLAGTGNIVGLVVGSLSETLDALTSSATGTVYTHSSGDLTEALDGTTLVGTGTTAVLVSGVLAETLDNFTSTSDAAAALTSTIVDLMTRSLIDLGYTGGTVQMLLQYYQANGATSNGLADAEKQFLLARGVTASDTIADMWVEYFTSRGFTSSLTQGMSDFWGLNGGAV